MNLEEDCMIICATPQCHPDPHVPALDVGGIILAYEQYMHDKGREFKNTAIVEHLERDIVGASCTLNVINAFELAIVRTRSLDLDMIDDVRVNEWFEHVKTRAIVPYVPQYSDDESLMAMIRRGSKNRMLCVVAMIKGLRLWHMIHKYD